MMHRLYEQQTSLAIQFRASDSRMSNPAVETSPRILLLILCTSISSTIKIFHVSTKSAFAIKIFFAITKTISVKISSGPAK